MPFNISVLRYIETVHRGPAGFSYSCNLRKSQRLPGNYFRRRQGAEYPVEGGRGPRIAMPGTLNTAGAGAAER